MVTLKQIWASWNEFWFEPQPATPVAIYRIIYGLQVLQWCLLIAPFLYTWYGKHSVLSIEALGQLVRCPRFNLLLLFNYSDQWVLTLFILMAVAALLLTLGLFTRISAAVVFVCFLSFVTIDPLPLNSGDSVLKFAALYLMLSHAGECFSVDRLIKKRKGESSCMLYSPWAQRLLQIQTAAVYFHSFACKSAGSMWWDGTAVYYSSRLEEFFRFPIPYVFDHLWTCKLLTWFAFGTEFAMWTLIWVKELRYYVLAAGVMLHLGIDWSMNIPQFETIMIATYINFIDPKDLARIMEFIKAKLGRSQNNKLAQSSN